MTNRYEGKPLLRLLECYVLNVIGELSGDDEVSLKSLAPNLRKIYHCEGNWHEIVESIMDLPRNFPNQVEEMWVKNKQLAIENGEDLQPQDFAEMFVDRNLT